ncbi:uncharacterized protein BO95DRAFT_146771 [Aspergillus brunneoviolaceus CBS 621.78]|uniref:Uncharacterized protein n=1 Tax=Aspergillus brunneoviolaceus CBS 621.78 TaxID=1450534 RepID=A0ACD1G880_9EURO|nr:hypothetical protein BO95DRAFT_146771 [Aspergillus brunneoviolaceus CBS 621.78]RAH45331.1 hypothetical protein BO95DRAFT_146771 [Aspergillus brunneoviolaceus CBS 621.78]
MPDAPYSANCPPPIHSHTKRIDLVSQSVSVQPVLPAALGINSDPETTVQRHNSRTPSPSDPYNRIPRKPRKCHLSIACLSYRQAIDTATFLLQGMDRHGIGLFQSHCSPPTPDSRNVDHDISPDRVTYRKLHMARFPATPVVKVIRRSGHDAPTFPRSHPRCNLTSLSRPRAEGESQYVRTWGCRRNYSIWRGLDYALRKLQTEHMSFKSSLLTPLCHGIVIS